MTDKFTNPDDNQDTIINESDSLSDIDDIGSKSYENYYGSPETSDRRFSYDKGFLDL